MALPAIAGCSPDAPTNPTPVQSIVLITVDTLRADATSPYGAPEDLTPNFAAFARGAIQYQRATASMPTTGPSHLTMFTGLHPAEHGSMRNGVPAQPGIVTVADRLGNAGWTCAAFVSVRHLHPLALGVTGFDPWDTPSGTRDGAATVSRALAWLADHGDGPFFLWVHLFDPHSPYRADPDPPPSLAELATLDAVPAREDYGFLAAPLDDRAARKMKLLYSSEVRYADRQVGRLLRTLDERPDADRMLVVVTSDHGEVLDELAAEARYAFDHGEYLRPEEIRVPLWVKGAAFEATRVEEVVELRALHGSLLWAAGHSVSGAPVLPHLGRDPASEPGAAFVTRRAADPGELPPDLAGDRVALVTRHAITIRQSGVNPSTASWRFPTDGGAMSHRHPNRADRGALLDAWWATQLASAEGIRQEIPEELREHLRSLGYIR